MNTERFTAMETKRPLPRRPGGPRGARGGPGHRPRPRRRDGWGAESMNTERFTAMETKRLLFRRLRESDLVSFLAYRNDPEVARYQDWEGCTEGEARGMIRALQQEEPFVPGEWFQFAVELQETGELVGDLSFRVG